MLVGVVLLVFIGLAVVLCVVYATTRGRPHIDTLSTSVRPTVVQETGSTPATLPSEHPSLNLPVLSFDEDDDLEETTFGADHTQVGPTSELEAGPAAKILYDDDAAPEEPTDVRRLILVSATGQSDRGKRRERNEDSLLVQESEGLFVVADGMGGYRGGDIASTLAVKTIQDAFEANSFPGPPHAMMPRRASELVRAIQLANRAVHARAREDRDLEGMGTTVCAARFSVTKQRLYIGHVGDSRVYRLRAGALVQMTSDHTMRDLGVEGTAAGHLSRAVGIWPVVPVDIILGKPRAGDTYLLCSDGLTKMVEDSEIERVLTELSPEQAVSRLISAANDFGGKDNVTVVVVQIHSPMHVTAA